MRRILVFTVDTAYANQTISKGDFFIIKVTGEDGTTANLDGLH